MGWTSASNADPDALCPKRHLSQKSLPKTETESKQNQKDREGGRRIHAALAVVTDNIVATLTVAEREVFDACRKIEKAEANRFFTPEDGQVRVFREQEDGSSRLWCQVPDGRGGYFKHSGLPDVIFRAGKKALIIEYKTLAGDVPESADNRQLRDQAVLLKGNVPGIELIGVLVNQPLVTHSPVVCVYDTAALKRAEHEMFDRVRASNDPNAQAIAGKRQCNFCAAKNYCVEYQRWAGAMVPAMLNVLDVPVSAWTPEQRGYFCDNYSIASKWLDTSRAECERVLAEDPAAVVGWELKPGSIKETIIQPETVFQKFCQVGGTQEAFMTCVSVGKTKLKEALAKVTGAKGKSLDEAIKVVTAGCVSASQNKPSLVKKD